MEVWNAAGIWNLIRSEFDVVEGVSELIFKLLEVLDQNIKPDFAVVMWCLWRRRNKMVWNSEEMPVNFALHDARMVVIHNWSQSHYQKRNQQRFQVQEVQQWKKPTTKRFNILLVTMFIILFLNVLRIL